MRVKTQKNKTVRAVISIVSFLIVVIFLLEICSGVLSPKVNRIKNGIKDYQSTGYCSEPENTIDVVVLGNSNAYCSVTPMEIWNSYGITSYNCGESMSRLSDMYFKLVDVLNYQTPKVVLLETDAFFPSGSASDDLDGSISAWLTHVMPVFEYHDRWKMLSKEDFIMTPDYYMHISSKGYILSRVVTPYLGTGDYMVYTDEEKNPHLTTAMYFDKIYNLCSENGIQLVLFDVPTPYAWNYQKHNGIMKIAEDYDVPFLDTNLFYDDIGIDLTTDTRDSGNHLNYSGACKISNYLGQYLSEHYNLVDYREYPEFSQWNEDYETYIQDVGKNA